MEIRQRRRERAIQRVVDIREGGAGVGGGVFSLVLLPFSSLIIFFPGGT